VLSAKDLSLFSVTGVTEGMITITPFLKRSAVFTRADFDACIAKRGGMCRRSRDRVLTTLCADGALVRVQRGLYASVLPTGDAPDPYSIAAVMAPDSVLGCLTALEVRGVLPRTSAECVYFTNCEAQRPRVVWDGVTLRAVSHPSTLLRRKTLFVETELLTGSAGDRLRVATVERAVVDIVACVARWNLVVPHDLC
jgi:hypothetical protein